MMNEKIEKAEQGAAMLVDDLRDICQSAVTKNDNALFILAGQLTEQAAKIRDILSQLK